MVLAIATVGFRSLEREAPMFSPPRPSTGTWEHDYYYGWGDTRPNEPSIFMPNYVPEVPEQGSGLETGRLKTSSE